MAASREAGISCRPRYPLFLAVMLRGSHSGRGNDFIHWWTCSFACVCLGEVHEHHPPPPTPLREVQSDQWIYPVLISCELWICVLICQSLLVIVMFVIPWYFVCWSSLCSAFISVVIFIYMAILCITHGSYMI